MTIWLFIAVAVAGGLGAALRFMIDSTVINRVQLNFPWTTFAINVSGALLLGWLTSATAELPEFGNVALALGAGLLGGYTTFSTASYDSVRLLQEKRYWSSLANAMGTLVTTVAAAALGFYLGSSL